MTHLLVYIHGFNSSSQSFKARLLREEMARRGRAAAFACPDLPHRPAAAVAMLEALLASSPSTCLVGSSLGGYYATWLAERHGLRAVLLNPAVRPCELLRGFLGTQRNLHTGAAYELTQDHLAELEALEVPAPTPARYLVVVATGDEVLDHRAALARYRGARQLIVPGDHGLSDFGRYLGTVLRFCGVPA